MSNTNDKNIQRLLHYFSFNELVVRVASVALTAPDELRDALLGVMGRDFDVPAQRLEPGAHALEVWT